MSTISRVLVQLSFLQLFKIENTSQIDLRAWVANQKYFIDELHDKEDFILYFKYKEYIAVALANDCNRMATAAIESIEGIQKEPFFHKCSAWLVIRAYYASFFAAHALLRIFGRSCTQLESEHAAKVFEMALAQGKANGITKIESGFYSAMIDYELGKVHFKKLKDSHADTWSEFNRLIHFLMDNLEHTISPAKNREISFDYLKDLKSNISRSGCATKGNWLSNVRNNVNYRHEYGVWFPYINSLLKCDDIIRLARYWKDDPQLSLRLQMRNELELFIATCVSVVSLLRDIINEAIPRMGTRRNIFKNWAAKILNLSGAV